MYLKCIAYSLHEQVITFVYVIIELHWMHVLDILMCTYIFIFTMIILKILGNINKYVMAFLWLFMAYFNNNTKIQNTNV